MSKHFQGHSPFEVATRVLALFAVVGLLVLVWLGAAQAHHGKVHHVRYESVNAPAYMPSTITIRCRGALTDRLVLVGYLVDKAVYRCKG